MTNFYDNVPDAAKHLDKVHEGWYNKINTSKLEMCHEMYCILGQLYGDYLHGRDTLGIPSCSNAFSSSASEFDWAVEIEKRRKTVVETEEEIINQIEELQKKLDKMRNHEISITMTKKEWSFILWWIDDGVYHPVVDKLIEELMRNGIEPSEE